MRAGVFTLGLSLMLAGGALLACNLQYCQPAAVLRWWPLILVLLGVEVLVRYYWPRAQGSSFHGAWDRGSLFLVIMLCLALAGGNWLVGVAGQFAGGWWPWEVGWFPGAQAHKTLTALAEVPAGAKQVGIDVPSGPGVSIRISGEGNRVEAELRVSEPGPTEEEASRLAGRWELRITPGEEVTHLQVVKPGAPWSRRGNSELVVRVPARLGVVIQDHFGPVSIRDVASCRVENSFGPVRVQGVVGPIDIRNRHGEVEVDWAVPPAGDCLVQAEYAPLRVTIPAGAGFLLDAEAQFGEIDLPRDLALKNEEPGQDTGRPEASVSDRNRSVARGTVGAGGPRLVLRSRHGDITIGSR